MCVRFSMTFEIEPLMDFFEIRTLEFGVPYRPRYNIAPTDPVLTYGADGPGTGDMMRWGFIPSWRKPDQTLPSAFNARGETLAANGMFRESFERRRCLVLADGYYEWIDEGTVKRPYRIGLRSWEPFGFAALWDEWHGPDGPVRSCTIVTTVPNELTRPIHDRMPVVLPPDAHARWLDPANTTGEGLTDLLVPLGSDAMALYQVSTKVNSVRNDTPNLIDEVQSERQGSLGL